MQGTGFTTVEVDNLSTTLNPDVLDGYFREVCTRTRTWLESVAPDELNEILLQWGVIGHSHSHLGAMGTVCTALGYPGV